MKAPFLLIALVVALGSFSCHQISSEAEPQKPVEPTLTVRGIYCRGVA